MFLSLYFTNTVIFVSFFLSLFIHFNFFYLFTPVLLSTSHFISLILSRTLQPSQHAPYCSFSDKKTNRQTDKNIWKNFQKLFSRLQWSVHLARVSSSFLVWCSWHPSLHTGVSWSLDPTSISISISQGSFTADHIDLTFLAGPSNPTCTSLREETWSGKTISLGSWKKVGRI